MLRSKYVQRVSQTHSQMTTYIRFHDHSKLNGNFNLFVVFLLIVRSVVRLFKLYVVCGVSLVGFGGHVHGHVQAK